MHTYIHIYILCIYMYKYTPIYLHMYALARAKRPQFQKQDIQSWWSCDWPPGIAPSPFCTRYTHTTHTRYTRYTRYTTSSQPLHTQFTHTTHLSFKNNIGVHVGLVFGQLVSGQGLFLREPRALGSSINSERAEPHVFHCHIIKDQIHGKNEYICKPRPLCSWAKASLFVGQWLLTGVSLAKERNRMFPTAIR